MKKNVRRGTKTAMATALAVLLVLALLPLMVFAEHGDNGSYKEQIVCRGGGSYFDSSGTSVKPNSENNNWAVSMSKTVSDKLEDGTQLPENEFEITLQVQTTEDIRSNELTPDTAVVLVIDISSSMAFRTDVDTTASATTAGLGLDYDSTNRAVYSNLKTNSSRMAIAKAKALDFLDEYVKGANGDARWVSLVSFGTNAAVEQTWLDVSNPANMNSMKSKIDQLKTSWVSGSSSNQLTFTQGGFALAKNLLGYADVSLINKQNCFVVTITDGNPTAYTTSAISSTATTVAPSSPTSGVMENATYVTPGSKNASAAAADIKGTGAALYTIAFSVYGNSFDRGNGTNYNGYDWLTNDVASAGCSLKANDPFSLADAFATINEQIATLSQAWLVSDKIGSGIVNDSGIFYNAGNDTHTWPLREQEPNNIEVIESGNNRRTVYTYIYKYLITLDTLRSDFVKNTPVYTNAFATLNFVIRSANGEYVQFSKEFAKPQVKGFADGLVFTKVGSDGKILNGYRFKLSHDEECACGLSTAYERTAISSMVDTREGVVSFANVPSGHSYVLAEQSHPNPYSASYDTDATAIPVTVSYGLLTCAVKGEEFENPAKPISIPLEKYFTCIDENCDFDMLRENYTFYFDLMNKNGAVIETLELELTKEAILALIDGGGFAVTGFKNGKDYFTIPVSEFGNSPFTVSERIPSGADYMGWALAPNFEINLELVTRTHTIPTILMDNNLGSLKRPYFVISKYLLEEKGNSSETFHFNLYDGEGLVRSGEELFIDGSGNLTVILDDYVNADATLRLVEVNGGVFGMHYDNTEYIIEIIGGTVVSINGNRIANAVFTNVYREPTILEFKIVKTTEGKDGTFTFAYSYDGTVWDGVNQSTYDSIKAEKTISISTEEYYGETEAIKPADLVNFTGTITVSEVNGGQTVDGWTYDPVVYNLSYFEGVLLSGTKIVGDTLYEISAEDMLVSFHNTYLAPPPPPPPPSPQPPPPQGYGSLVITKVISGVTIPADYDATFTVTGPGYNKTFTYAKDFVKGALTLANLSPGSYTVTETGATAIDGCDWTVTSTADGAIKVTEGRASDVTVTNTYTYSLDDDEVFLIEIDEGEPPLVGFPSTPEITDDTIVDDPEIPLTKLPQTSVLFIHNTIFVIGGLLATLGVAIALFTRKQRKEGK
ncbi:MAG: VWA domain-containing protein [Oscillospiraceae bacterium]|jgi:hypothetical protein|nr:VWA domain-containing protein [Oscillospiraceae bacterium]